MSKKNTKTNFIYKRALGLMVFALACTGPVNTSGIAAEAASLVTVDIQNGDDITLESHAFLPDKIKRQLQKEEAEAAKAVNAKGNVNPNPGSGTANHSDQKEETEELSEEDQLRKKAGGSEDLYRVLCLSDRETIRQLAGSEENYRPVIVSRVTSSYVSNPDSRTNALKAAEYMNNTVVLSGSTFSYNKVVGDRSLERGFVLAPSISYGDVMEKTVGGGICQTSSMCYDAALLAGMEIKERHPHTLQVPYATAGFDASVVWNQWDFRFKNPYSVPVAILVGANDKKGVLELYVVANGRDPMEGITYHLKSEKVAEYGYHSKVLKIKDGKVVDTKDLGYNYYYGTTTGVNR